MPKNNNVQVNIFMTNSSKLIIRIITYRVALQFDIEKAILC